MTTKMAKWLVQADTGLERHVARFDTQKDAEECAYLVRSIAQPGVVVTAGMDLPGLYGWNPDTVDATFLRSMWGLRDSNGTKMANVACIKYVRAKSLSGLKDAKDWCDAYL